MISVVIPLYNKEQDIKETVLSVLNQSYENFEIIVINDSSTDNSLQVIQSINDDRIRVFTKKNGGVCSARNYGIKKAIYEWIALLDADDLWDQNHLELLVQAINKFPNHKFFASNLKDHEISKPYPEEHNFVLQDFYSSYLSMKSIVNSSTCVIHRDVFDTVGFFNESLVRGEDIEMWDRIAQKYPLVKINAETVNYRLDASNRAMHKSVPLEKCFVEVIPSSSIGKNTTRSKFLKHHVILKLKSTLIRKEYKDFLKLMCKYNFRLLK